MQTYNPTLLLKDLQGLFFQEYHSAESMVWKDMVATTVDSSANLETYAFAGPAPQMVAVTDEVQFTPMSDTSYALTNTTYAAGISVSRAQLDDDQLGGIKLRISQMASVAQGHKNSIVSSLLTSGTSDACYDAVSFFNDSHPARASEGGTQDNLLAGSSISTANLQTDLSTGISTMMTFLGENGEPFMEAPTMFTIVTPPANLWAFREAVNSQLVSNTSNVRFQGISFDIVADPRMASTDANDWYLLCTSGVKPLIFQNRDPLEFTAQDDESASDAAFVREQYKYKARARYVGGYSYWQKALKFVVS